MKHKSSLIGIILICSGIVLIASALIMKQYSIQKEASLLSTYTASIQALTPSEAQTIQTSPAMTAEHATTPSDVSVTYQTGEPIGILNIPSISLSCVIVEGSDKAQLKASVGHISGTAFPGENGNCAIAGHRNYTYGQYFNRLNELKPGDTLSIEQGTHTYTYEVTDTKVVVPEDTSVLSPTTSETLTLITCTPIYIASHRLIVTAKRIS